MKILVFDNYDSFTYNLVHLVEKILHQRVDVYRNDQVALEKAKEYVKNKRISILRIEALFLPVDDPQIDFYTLSFDEQKQRLEKRQERRTS